MKGSWDGIFQVKNIPSEPHNALRRQYRSPPGLLGSSWANVVECRTRHIDIFAHDSDKVKAGESHAQFSISLRFPSSLDDSIRGICTSKVHLRKLALNLIDLATQIVNIT